MSSSKQVVKSGVQMSRLIKPIKSATAEEARRNVRTIYKKWMKELPVMLHHYDDTLDRSRYEMRLGFKRQFLKNAHVRDLRVIDRLVNEATLEYDEMREMVTPSYTILNRLFQEHVERKPTDFLSKFFAGKN